jgi:hypothetical protein
MALLDHEKCGIAAALQLWFIHHYYTGPCQQIARWAQAEYDMVARECVPRMPIARLISLDKTNAFYSSRRRY